MRLYSSGSSPPAGWGVSRLTGMWVCSGNQIDSNPRDSASIASSAGWADSAVGKMARPKSMRAPYALGAGRRAEPSRGTVAP